jgi:glycosyltransferase involved in cell wall biosynthesis
MKVSVAMISLNDGKNIYNAIKGCDFADEIVIVDGGSSDITKYQLGKAAIEFGDKLKFFENRWPNHFGDQRNISFSKCTGDWILRVDTDEICGTQLRGSIHGFLTETPDECISVRIRQNNLVMDGDHYAANLGGWETHPRLFRNTGNLKWIGQVHEWVEGVNHSCTDWNVCVIHAGWLDVEKLREKEKNYMKIPGSGFEKEGSLTERHYEIRKLPKGIF